MTQPKRLSSARAVSTKVVRHDGWTRERQAAFLRELAATHCVSTAAKAVGMSRTSAYALRARLKGEPFDRAWQAALLNRFDELAEAAMERALKGVEVPHYYKGELVGVSRRYDERLTVALLAMRNSFRPSPRRTARTRPPTIAPTSSAACAIGSSAARRHGWRKSAKGTSRRTMAATRTARGDRPKCQLRQSAPPARFRAG